MTTKDLEAAMSPVPKSTIPGSSLLGTGSTLVNLACTGRARGGFYKGGYFHIAGASDSGKSWIKMNTLAEANINKNFDDYDIIHDDPEDGTLMDVGHYFGQGVLDRLQPPPRGTSEWVEDFYFNFDEVVKKGKPFIYLLDSMDALDSREDDKKFTKAKSARRKQQAGEDGQEAGSYGMAKAKANSAGLRRAKAKLRQTDSILIIISQVRDNIGFGAKFNPERLSGGRALKFHARLQLWLTATGPITRSVKGKKRQIGITTKVQIKKNHVTGRKRSVEIPIYHTSGIDDVGSCVHYLVDENHWREGKGGTFKAPEFEFEGTEEQLVQKIEEEDLERQLRVLTAEVWNEIDAACVVERKNRYE